MWWAASPLWVPVFRPGREAGVTRGPVRPAGLGQLLVWEWQSESYVLKQQGHFNSMVSLAYSPDGQHIVTGGDDGKVGWLCRVGGPPSCLCSADRLGGATLVVCPNSKEPPGLLRSCSQARRCRNEEPCTVFPFLT